MIHYLIFPILLIFFQIIKSSGYYVPANGDDWTILKPPSCKNKLPGQYIDSLPFTFGIVVNPYILNEDGDYEKPIVSKIKPSLTTTTFVTSIITTSTATAPGSKPTKTKDIIVQIHDGQVQKMKHKHDYSSGGGDDDNKKHIPINSCNNKYQFFKGVNYGIISGTLTAHTFLFAKSIIDVIIETILHESFKNLFTITNALPYLLLLTMLSIVGLQLTAFNLGLAQITTAILYPLCFLIYNLINLINDLIFNSLITSHKMTWLQLIWIIIGLIGVLCGVVILSWDSAFNVNQNQRNLKNGHERGIGIGIDNDNYNDADLISMKFPYNSGTGNEHDGNADLNQSYLFDRVDEQTELLEGSGSRSGSTPLSSSSSYNSADNGSLKVYKPYSDEPTKDQASVTIARQNEQEANIEALIQLNDEAAIDAEISMLSNNSNNHRMSFEQNQLLNLLDLN